MCSSETDYTIQVSYPKFYIVGITGILISKSGRNRNKPTLFGQSLNNFTKYVTY